MTVEGLGDKRHGARPNLTSLRVESRESYVRWWLDNFGAEAYVIAKAFMLGGGLGLVDEREAA